MKEYYEWIFMAFQIGVIASVYTVKLTEQEMIFGWIYGKLSGIAARKPWTEIFLKPLILCTSCVAGQMALWTLILYGWFHLELVRTGIDVLFFLSLPIIFVQIINKVWNG